MHAIDSIKLFATGQQAPFDVTDARTTDYEYDEAGNLEAVYWSSDFFEGVFRAPNRAKTA